MTATMDTTSIEIHPRNDSRAADGGTPTHDGTPGPNIRHVEAQAVPKTAPDTLDEARALLGLSTSPPKEAPSCTSALTIQVDSAKVTHDQAQEFPVEPSHLLNLGSSASPPHRAPSSASASTGPVDVAEVAPDETQELLVELFSFQGSTPLPPLPRLELRLLRRPRLVWWIWTKRYRCRIPR